MRIALVTDAWTPQVNGVVRTLTTTVAHLRGRGHHVLVIEPSQFRGIPAGGLLKGMSIPLPPYRMERLFDAEAVHIATEGALGLAAKRFCDRHGIRYTTAVHTNFPAYMRANFRLPEAQSYRFMRWFHRKATRVMVPTQSMIDELAANGFTNCALWGRGVDTDLFQPEPRPDVDAEVPFDENWPRPWWINVGRVSREKNLEDFLALGLPGTSIVVGDGPDRKRLAAEYPDVKFVGPLYGEVLPAAYRAADVFVFPSKFDTFGLVIAEAISCGLPVVGYPVTGPIDIVEDRWTGVLAKGDTREDLREACNLSLLLIGRVEGQFSWAKATDQFEGNLVMGMSSAI